MSLEVSFNKFEYNIIVNAYYLFNTRSKSMFTLERLCDTFVNIIPFIQFI